MIPDTARILRVLRREIETTLLPELTSPRAQTMARMMDVVMRHLIQREEKSAELLRARIEEDSAALGSGSAADHSEDGAAAWQHSDALARALEHAVAAGTADTSRAIRAETAFTDAAMAYEQALQHPVFDDPERLDVTAAKLEAFLRRAWPERRDLSVHNVERVLGGFSKSTFIIDFVDATGAHSVVIRRDNPFGAVDSTAEDEYRLLRELHRLGLPVPAPLLFEADAGILGEPFFMSEKAPGRPVPNMVGLVMSEAHADAARGLARVLGRLRRLDIRKLAPGTLPPVGSVERHLQGQIDALEASWRQYRVVPSPTIVAAFAWLRANAPVLEEPLVLVHGDAGLHNLLMDGARIGAMLDWEFAHVGEAAEDLIYSRLWVERIMKWDDFMAEYVREGGVPVSLENTKFYKVFHNVRHVMNINKSLSGFLESPQPEINGLVSGLNYERLFRSEVGKLIG